MTELAITIHAKDYIDKLANGIDPLTGEILPESDIVNNVRISRCLFYVSGILGQVIENGGTSKKAASAKKAFALTQEQKAGVVLPQKAIALSELAKLLNEASDTPNMKKIGYRDLSAWLLAENYLRKETHSDGKEHLRPEEKGIQLGISVETRRSSMGHSYEVVLYSPEAQRFLLEHLDDICAAVKEREAELHRPWNTDDDVRLLNFLDDGLTEDSIAEEMHRKPKDVRARMAFLEKSGEMIHLEE